MIYRLPTFFARSSRLIIIFITLFAVLIFGVGHVFADDTAKCEYLEPGDQEPWWCGGEWNNTCGDTRYCFGTWCGTNSAVYQCTPSGGCNTNCSSGGDGDNNTRPGNLEPIFLRTYYSGPNGYIKYLNPGQVDYRSPRSQGVSPELRPAWTIWQQDITVPELINRTDFNGILPQSNPQPTFHFEFWEDVRLAYGVKIFDAYYLTPNSIDWLKKADQSSVVGGRNNYDWDDLPYNCNAGSSPFPYCDDANTIKDNLSVAKFGMSDIGDAFDGGGAVILMEAKKSVVGRVIGLDKSTNPPTVVGLPNIEIYVNVYGIGNIDITPGNTNDKSGIFTDGQGYFRLNDSRVSDGAYYTVSVASNAPTGYYGNAKAVNWNNLSAADGTKIPYTWNQLEDDNNNNPTPTYDYYDTKVGDREYWWQSTVHNTDCSSLQSGEMGRCLFAFEVDAPESSSTSITINSNTIRPGALNPGDYDFAICPANKNTAFTFSANVSGAGGNQLSRLKLKYKGITADTATKYPWQQDVTGNSVTINKDISFLQALPGNGYYVYLEADTSIYQYSCKSYPAQSYASGYYCGVNPYDTNPLDDPITNRPWHKMYAVRDTILPANVTATTNQRGSVNLSWTLPNVSDNMTYTIYRNNQYIGVVKYNQNTFDDVVSANNGLVCDGSNVQYRIDAVNGYNFFVNPDNSYSYTSCGNVKSVNVTGACQANQSPNCTIECKTGVDQYGQNIYGACPNKNYLPGETIALRGRCIDPDNDPVTTSWSEDNTGNLNPTNPAPQLLGYMYTTYTNPATPNVTSNVNLSGTDGNLTHTATQSFTTGAGPASITCSDILYDDSTPFTLPANPTGSLANQTFDVNQQIQLYGQCDVYDSNNQVIPGATTGITYTWTVDHGNYTNPNINPTRYTLPSQFGTVITVTLTATYTSLTNTISRTVYTPSYQNSWIQIFDGGYYINGVLDLSGKSIPNNLPLVGNADISLYRVLPPQIDVYDHFSINNKYNSGGFVQASQTNGIDDGQFGQPNKNYRMITDMLLKKHSDLDMRLYFDDFDKKIDQISATNGYGLISKRVGSTDLNLNGAIDVTASNGISFVLVKGRNINITGNLLTTDTNEIVVFITDSDVTVQKNVTKIDGIYILSSSQIEIEGQSNNDDPLLFNGGIYADQIAIQRDLKDIGAYLDMPAVRGLYDPNLIVKVMDAIPSQVGIANVYWVIVD